MPGELLPGLATITIHGIFYVGILVCVWFMMSAYNYHIKVVDKPTSPYLKTGKSGMFNILHYDGLPLDDANHPLKRWCANNPDKCSNVGLDEANRFPQLYQVVPGQKQYIMRPKCSGTPRIGNSRVVYFAQDPETKQWKYAKAGVDCNRFKQNYAWQRNVYNGDIASATNLNICGGIPYDL